MPLKVSSKSFSDSMICLNNLIMQIVRPPELDLPLQNFPKNFPKNPSGLDSSNLKQKKERQVWGWRKRNKKKGQEDGGYLQTKLWQVTGELKTYMNFSILQFGDRSFEASSLPNKTRILVLPTNLFMSLTKPTALPTTLNPQALSLQASCSFTQFSFLLL